MGTIPASENEYPEVLLTEGAAPAAPGANLVKVYAKSDGLPYTKDDAGAESPMTPNAHIADTADAHDASAVSFDPAGLSVIAATEVQTALEEVDAAIGAGGIPATIGDAKGDLVGFSAADTAVRVPAAAADGMVLESEAAGTGGLNWYRRIPSWVSALVGVTDTTNFYWDGNDVASFTAVTVTGSTTWGEGRNLLSVKASGMTSGDLNALLIAKTISTGDAWYVPLMGVLGHAGSGAVMAGICFTDGTTSTSNVIAAHVQMGLAAANQPNSLWVGRHGTLTAATTAAFISDSTITTGPLFHAFLRLTYVSANTFRMEIGDGVSYTTLGEADIAKTMTPTHVGIVVAQIDADEAICTFGPLRKV